MNIIDFNDTVIWNGCTMRKAYLDDKELAEIVPIEKDDNISESLAGATNKHPQNEHWAVLIYQDERGKYAMVDGICGDGGSPYCGGYQGMAVLADFFYAAQGHKNASSVICRDCANR